LMHAISSYRGNRPTNKQTHTQTGPITIHCAAKLSAQCKISCKTVVSVQILHIGGTHKYGLLRQSCFSRQCFDSVGL